MRKRAQEESVSGIIFSKTREEVLLIKRRDVPVWVLPGGGIDQGESPEEAIVRELEEETGYQTVIFRKVASYRPLNRLTRMTHFYECKILSGEQKLSEETKEIAFFSLSSLPPLPPPFHDWILDAKQNSPTLIEKEIASVTYPIFIKYLFLHPLLVIRFLLSRFGFHHND